MFLPSQDEEEVEVGEIDAIQSMTSVLTLMLKLWFESDFG